MNPLRLCVALVALLAVAACTGGGSGSAAPAAADTLSLTIDTAASSDAAVAAQIVAVALERADGSATPNLLAAPRLLTLADPTGATAGVALRGVDAGTYTAVHLIAAPGSAIADTATGTTTIDLPNDLRAPFATPFVHGGNGGWVDLHHTAPLVLATHGAHTTANPTLAAAPATDRLFADEDVTVVSASGDHVTAMLAGDALSVQLVVDADAELRGPTGDTVSPAAFVAACTSDTALTVSGNVDDTGSLHVRQGRHRGRNTGPLLLGRVTELFADTTSFTMSVREIVRAPRANRDRPATATVLATGATIHFRGSDQALTFADLLAGDRVEVAFTARDGTTFTAGDIAVLPRNSPAPVEVHGRVASVDVANRQLVLVPLGDTPFPSNGGTATELHVAVPADAVIFRVGTDRPARRRIGLGDVVGGSDEAWIRGRTGDTADLDARWMLVRTRN